MTLLSLLQIIESKKYYQGNFLICSKVNCPTAQGICTNDNKCACYEGFTTIYDDEFGMYQCNYPQKSQMKAFLLEFVLGFGVGHFYLGNYILAIIKLTFSFISAVIICFLPYFILSIRSKTLKNIFPYLQTVFGLIYTGWQVTDGILIALLYYKDGNDMDMQEW
jgi:TM2 domain-containing membrane protein YozV